MKGIIRKLTPETYLQSYLSLPRLGVLPVLVTQLGVIVVSFADTMMVGMPTGSTSWLPQLLSTAFSLWPQSCSWDLPGRDPSDRGSLWQGGSMKRGGRMLRGGLAGESYCGLIVHGDYEWIVFLSRQVRAGSRLASARQKVLSDNTLHHEVPMAVFNCFQQAANCTTDTATPMWLILGADVLNICGNYLLIFGKFGFPELGLAGAGISTLIARTLCAVAIVVVFAMRKRYRVYWRSVVGSHAEGRRRYRVWVTSYPLMIQSGVECGLWSFGAVVSGWFGKVQLAAYQVMNTIAQLGYMTYMGFGWATSIRVANFTGVEDINGIRRITCAGLHMVLALATLVSVVFLFFTEPLVHLFTPDANVAVQALLLVVPLILYQYCDAVQLTYVNALRGTSVVKPLLWISIVSYLFVGIPLLLFMAVTLDMATQGVYFSFSGALLTASVPLIVAFNRVLRQKEREKVE